MSGQKSPFFGGVQSGLWRTGVWKTSFWGGLALGSVYGSLQLMYHEMVTLPAAAVQEKQRRESAERAQYDNFAGQIAELQKRLEVYEPKPAVEENVDAKFALNDLEVDDVLDKWITAFADNVDEMGIEDSLQFADNSA
eukprot:TRINITY_DN10829_c0_g1_i1.p1 TRINITY_DN10829_c0_g1~~TRINITY_DN10829_c0_g1_i1.p1  ORF type:complete len:145 (-),score=43.68 TRINITY_DN10829_c0_g1_i1:37-450(-)